MDLNIRLEHLNKDELAHELTVLHIPYTTEHTCDDLRKLLRQTRVLLRRGSLKPLPEAPQADPQVEIAACQAKIVEIEAAVSSGRNLTPSQSDRLVGRANYYLGRLARLLNQDAATSNLKGKLVNCLSILNPESESSESEIEIFKSPGKPEVKAVCHTEPRYNLCSLNLKYKGDTCVRAFITRLEELRISRDIPERVIYNGFPEILEGPALFWYRDSKSLYATYGDLLAALRDNFDIPDFDFKLRREINARTQARHESIVVYLSIMGGLFSRLTKPVPEAEKLDIILRNIRPEYSRELALIDIVSLPQLKSLCMKLELASVRAGDFAEPSTSRYTVAPDIQLTTGNSQVHKHKIASVRNPPPKSDKDFCFRCNENGHRTIRCPHSREIVCFKCGYKGVRTSECPSCNQCQSKN